MYNNMSNNMSNKISNKMSNKMYNNMSNNTIWTVTREKHDVSLYEVLQTIRPTKATPYMINRLTFLVTVSL